MKERVSLREDVTHRNRKLVPKKKFTGLFRFKTLTSKQVVLKEIQRAKLFIQFKSKTRILHPIAGTA